MSSPIRSGSTGITVDSFVFSLKTLVFVLVAHAVASLTHEYSHSLTAWLLGWMKQPFGIDYGNATVFNVILLQDVSDNVDYTSIFAGGGVVSAALIALAGPFIGNGALYFILYGLMSTGFIKSRRFFLEFFYWLALMCAGNVWSYVPIRSISTHADIAIAAKGLGLSTWALFPFVMALSGYITWHFFCRMFPEAYKTITANAYGSLPLLITLTSFWYFGFFGVGGLSGSYGLVSQMLSIASCGLLFPLCVVYLSSRYADKNRGETNHTSAG
jgi:hypothetical protein